MSREVDCMLATLILPFQTKITIFGILTKIAPPPEAVSVYICRSKYVKRKVLLIVYYHATLCTIIHNEAPSLIRPWYSYKMVTQHMSLKHEG